MTDIFYPTLPSDEYNFKIKFGGESHDINAQTFIQSLQNVNILIGEINSAINAKKIEGQETEVRIKALEPGSFEVVLELIQHAPENLNVLFKTDAINYAAGIITIFSGLYQLKKFLKSEKPTAVEPQQESKIKVENVKGDVIIINQATLNIYENNPLVRNSISKTFEILDKDPKVEGFEIKDSEEKQIFSSERKEFQELSESDNYEDVGKKELLEVTKLNIIKVAFEGKYKWDFYYKGHKISAKILDNEFHEKINNGESFAKGDTLEVELIIHQEFDKGVNTFINKSFEIRKVLNHYPRPKQSKMF